MKKILSIALILFMVLTSVIPISAEVTDKAEPVKIPIVEVLAQGKAAADELYQAGLDVLSVDLDGENYIFTIMVKEFEQEYFAANNIDYIVVQEDATAQVEWLGYQMAVPAGRFSAAAGEPIPGIPHNVRQPDLTIDADAMFNPTNVLFDDKYGFPRRLGYRTVTEYYAEMNYLAETYPSLVKKHIIGRSFEGVPMVALEISNAPGAYDGRPGALHQGGNHAREWPSNELSMNTAWYLVTQYGIDPTITNLLNTTTCWFLPVTNPDGTHYDQRVSPGSWRKNRRANPGGSFGVDVNRNWPYGWGSNNGSSGTMTSDTYRGTAPRSEFEVQAVTSVYESNQILSSVSGHTSGQLIIYAWGHRFNNPGNHPLLAELGRRMADYNLHADQYSESLYAASGDLCDYTYGAARTLHYTIEYGRSFVPAYLGTNMYKAVTPYNDLYGRQRRIPLTYATNTAVAKAGPPAADITAPVAFVTEPFRTGYGSPDTVVTAAKVQALGDLTGKILMSQQGASANDTRDAILAAQAQGAIGVIFCGASSGYYSGGYAHYTPNFGTSGTSLNITIPVAGTSKPYLREFNEKIKAGDAPNTITITSYAENTESQYWQFERQIGTYMVNKSFAAEYAAHVKGKITDGTGALLPEATLGLELEIDNMVQYATAHPAPPAEPPAPMPPGTLTSKHTSIYKVKGGVYDWSVTPSKQPELANFNVPDKGYDITATGNGRYSQTKNVKVGWYKDVVDGVDFVIPSAITVDFDFSKIRNKKDDIRIPFATFVLNAQGDSSAKGVISGAAVSAKINDQPVEVESLGGGNYAAVFNPGKDLTIGDDDEVKLVIDFAGGPAHSAYTESFEIVNGFVISSVATDGKAGTIGATLKSALEQDKGVNAVVAVYDDNGILKAVSNVTVPVDKFSKKDFTLPVDIARFKDYKCVIFAWDSTTLTPLCAAVKVGL